MKKVVLITGASSGIGAVTAKYLSYRGHVVYGTSRNPKNNIAEFTMIRLDVLDVGSIENAVQKIVQQEGRIDVLINNAGMGITGPIEETPTSEMKRVFDTNFFGAIEVIKAVLPHMRQRQEGLIINITSIAGYMGLPFRGIYSATKGALELLTETLSMETRQFNIRVCNLAPGDFATNIASGRYHAPILENSDYKTLYQKNLDLMDAHVDSGKDPILMAKRINSIIEKKQPRLHYKEGEFMQKFSILLKRMLPDRIYEKLIMRHYGM